MPLGNKEDIENLRVFVSGLIRADRIKQDSLKKILSKEKFDSENDILNFIISTDGANLMGDHNPPNRVNLESLLSYHNLTDMVESWKLPEKDENGNSNPNKDYATIVFERGLRRQYARLAVRSIGTKTFTHPALQVLGEFTEAIKPKEIEVATEKEEKAEGKEVVVIEM